MGLFDRFKSKANDDIEDDEDYESDESLSVWDAAEILSLIHISEPTRRGI